MFYKILFCRSHCFKNNVVTVNNAGVFVKKGKAHRRSVKEGAVKFVGVGYFTFHVGAYDGVGAQEDA